MHTVHHIIENNFNVGNRVVFYEGEGEITIMHEFRHDEVSDDMAQKKSRMKAFRLANYLNGGTGDVFPYSGDL